MAEGKKLRTVFWGSPAFVQPVLDSLREHTDLIGIVSTPHATFPPLYARQYNLKHWAPASFDEAVIRQLKRTQVDFFVTLAYGKIIPTAVLEIPAIYPLNIHFSLLPKYRGASPVQTALLNGESSSGITLQVMAPAMDAGDILWQETLPLQTADTTGSVLDHFTAHVAPLLPQLLRDVAVKKITPHPQDETQATYCDKSLFSKEHALVNWEQTTAQVHNFIRAMYPEPIAYTQLTTGDKSLDLHIIEGTGAFPQNRYDTLPAGSWIIEKNALFVKTTNGYYQLLRVQPAGKRIQTASEFSNGYRRYLENDTGSRS